MIRRIKTSIKHWKLATMLAVFSIFFVIVACQDQVTNEALDVAQNSTMAIDLPEEIQARLDQLKKEHPDKKFIVFEPDQSALDKTQNLQEKLKASQIDPSMISTMEVYKDQKDKRGNLRSFVIIEYNEQANVVADRAQSGDHIFTIVEQTALPAGGMDGLISFLQQNLLYPKEAREQGLEGTVFVQFVVNTDGSLSDFTTIKGVSPVLDAEAIRVAKTFPSWTPGKQNGIAVRQRFVLPINFRLNNENARAPAITPDITEVKEDLKILSTTTESSGKKFIEGKVTDAAGNPLLGANLVIAGTTHGATTDAGGNFKLEISQKTGKVAVSFVGYKTNFISF
jgi:TonB family protein